MGARKALGDRDAAFPLVRTVRGFGFAFDGVAEPEPAPLGPAAHAIVRGVQAFPLAPGPNVLGRARDAALRIGHDTASREHASITVDGGRAEVVDLGSRNGTFVGGRRIEGPVLLRDGDEIVVGSVRLGYRSLGFDPSMSTRSAG